MKEYKFLSQLFLNFVDKDRKLDYVGLVVIGGWPIGLAWFLGLHTSYTVDGVIYLGYLDKINFWPMLFALPAALWALRWAFGLMAPLNSETLPTPPPGIVQLLRTQEAKEAVYQAMRSWMSSVKAMATVLIISIAIQIADLRELVGVFISDQAVRSGEFDWSVMYQIGIVSKQVNVIFNFFAYLTQFAITTIGVFGVAYLLSHNLFFLSRVYQRRLVPKGKEEHYISIELEDVNKCFGFRAANDAFNTQIIVITVAGFFVLMSRFSNVFITEENISIGDILQWPINLPITSFFPDIAQLLLAIGWFAALAIVSLPAVVKLLPRLPLGGNPPDLTITNYLHEFIPDSRWRYGENPGTNEIEYLSARFAENAFWPTGNNRASQLFFFSAWVFLVILFPIKTNDPGLLILSFGFLGLIAYGMRTGLFVLLNSSLSYVDERLIQLRPDKLVNAPQKQIHPKTCVFISYRREDSAAYSRLVRQSLLENMDESQIFMDIVGIRDGQDFVDTINEAILNCDVVIAIIGKNWVNSIDEEGNRRLMQNNDFVRLEISVALRENRLVIPTLVGDSTMPEADDLPDDLKALTRRQARELSNSRWDYDMRQLVKTLAEL